MNFFKFETQSLFISILLFLLSKEEIINNPIKISDHPNPLILHSASKILIYTSGEMIIIDKETGNIDSSTTFLTYNKPYVLCNDESNYFYIYSQKKLYRINPPSGYTSISLSNSISYPTNNYFIGYMKEIEYNPPTPIKTGEICKIYKDEIIIYGKSSSNLIFTFLLAQKSYQFGVSSNIEDQISCKKTSTAEYICAVVDNNKVKVYIFKCITNNSDPNDCKLNYLGNIQLSLLSAHTQVVLYDIEMENKKLICAKNITSLYVECMTFRLNVIRSESSTKYTYSASVTLSVILVSFPMDLSNNGECIYSSFNNEFLFCCGGTNLIKCSRINSDNIFINSFDINLEGENTHLTVLNSGDNYITFFFMNTLASDKIYEYYIYAPDCVNLEFTIIVFHSIYENIEGNKESINNFFTRYTNTDYYIEFENLPEEYGNFTLDDKILDYNTGKFLINGSYPNIIDFVSTNHNSVNNFEILYTISISETYSTQCKIQLTILPCYRSCDRCSKDDSSSNLEDHNCIENKCKENYYMDPTKSTNCFMISEKKSNWYFNYLESKFDICNELCVTCDGPSNTDCLTCYSPTENPEHAYLYNKECLSSCPIGTYKELKSEGYYKCLPCYINCKTCSALGDFRNMKCDSCDENDIFYSKNCFKEYDSKEKTFYLPGSTEISNCFDLIGYFIEENTYECVPTLPQNGYFLSNPVTGVFSPCHSDCKTCSRNYTENNSNCDICNNQDFNYFDGNCIENCPEGYYTFESISSNNKKTCRKCYDRCLTCIDGPILNNLNLITNMNCLTCKKDIDPNDSNNFIEKYIQGDGNCFPIITYTQEKIIFNISEINTGEEEKTCLGYGKSIIYGEYHCIYKPTNSFYVLNNAENTGVIEYCNEACNSCIGKKIGQDTNCIDCSDGYFKTEDSNTICILENLIPENFYKNMDDNIYYHCYIYCRKCSDYYDAENNNMNCDECIENYYFLHETKNCYDMDFIQNNEHYFSSEDTQFHKCYDTCEKCLVGGIDDNNQNCIKCINDYYFEDNTNNCYNMEYVEKGFYFDNFTINDGELPVFRKCYENCKTCTNKIIVDEMNCQLCKDDYYKINGTNNCYYKDLLNNGYYLEDNLFFPCEENCLTCSNSKTIINEIETNNCLSCDKINKGLYLVNELNNCEPIEFKDEGYYLEENINGIEIFYKCYQTCSLCDRGVEFDINTDQNNHNCLVCKENHYKLKNDLNPKNCYGNEMIEQGYILFRNFWQICHENCETCTGRPSYNEYNELISQNCITCFEDLKFIFETSNCANDSILENGYYLDDNDSKYHKCDIQCKTCDKYSTENDPKCFSCNMDQGYFPADLKPVSNCYNKTTIDPEYVFYQSSGENFPKIRKWTICYSTCKSCFSMGNENEHNCLSCISKHYLIYNTTNCINKEYALANNYYFNTTFRQYVKCNDACNTCNGGLVDGNTNCIKCNENEGYYPIEGMSDSMCFNSETIGEGYFLNNFGFPYKWSECYEYCATCEFKGNANKMSCLSCKKNLISPKYNKIMLYKLSNGNCFESCPDGYFLTKYGDCVEFCPNRTYEFIPNTSCVDSCPPFYEVNENRTRCVSSVFSETMNPSEFREIIFKNITNFVDSETIINSSDFKAQIISSDDLDPLEQIKKGISGIDLGNCIEALKTKYNIPEDEDLIIVEIETKEDKEKNKNLDKDKDTIDLGKNVQLSILDRTGRKLDMTYCNQEIKVMKIVSDLEEVDFNSAMEYSDQGIDIFNAQDSFFNDICHPYERDSDIVLGDRRIDLFQNVTFCGDNCNYKGMNYEIMIANCACDPSSIQMGEDSSLYSGKNVKGVTLNDLANSFTSELFDFNFIVVKCYNLVFNGEIIKKNLGFFILLFMNVFQLIFLIIFGAKCLKPIKNYMMVFEPFDPLVDPAIPPKRNYISNIVESENSKIFDLSESNNVNNKNLSKKEKEVQKTILINNLLRSSRNPKKEVINKNKKLDEDNDDALVIHYINSDDDNSQNKKKYNDIGYNSESESEIYKKKIKESLSKRYNSNNKIYNFKMDDGDDSRSNNNKTSSLEDNNSLDKKIFYRNNRNFNLYDIYNKGNFPLSKIKENQSKKSNFTPKNKSSKNIGTIPLSINPRKINKMPIEKIKYKSPDKRKDIILENIREDEDYIDNKNFEKINSYNNENIFESITIDIKKKRNSNNNNIKKYRLEPKNISILKTTDILPSNDNDCNNENKNLNVYLHSKKRKEKIKIKKEKEKEKENYITFRNNHNKNISSGNIILTSTKLETESEMNKEKIKTKLGNMRLKFKKVDYAYTDEELRGMNFEQALRHENRPFCRIYLAILIEEHIILNTFCTDAYVELRSVKLSFLVFSFQISFFLNAFFYTDEYISEIYHNNGVLNFFSSLPKSLYSFIVTLILANLLKILSNSKKQFMKIIKEREKKKDYIEQTENELLKLRKKLIIYYAIIFILGIFFFYYVSAFCAVYTNSQKFWLYGCLESLALDLSTPLPICLVLTSFRYLGLKKQTKCLYNTAGFLGNIL